MPTKIEIVSTVWCTCKTCSVASGFLVDIPYTRAEREIRYMNESVLRKRYQLIVEM